VSLVQIVGMLEQESANSLQDIFSQPIGGFAVQLPTQIRQLFVQQFDDMKAIEHMRRVGHVLPHSRAVRRREIHRHCFDLRLAVSKPPPERPQ
jgi:hypothetical protein